MKCLSSLSSELREQVLLAMLPDEMPVWAAQPVPTLVNRLSIPYIFFAVFALMISTLFVVMGGVSGLPFLLVLVGIPVAGVVQIYRRMKRTVYIISEHRALVVRPAGRKGWQTLAWPLTPGLVKERVLRADGSGDLILSYELGKGTEGDIDAEPRGFFNLPELRRVELLLADIQPVIPEESKNPHLDEIPLRSRECLENALLPGETVVWHRLASGGVSSGLYVLTNRRALVLEGDTCRCFPRHADMLYEFVRHTDGTVSLVLGPDWELANGKKPGHVGFLHLAEDEWEAVYDMLKKPCVETTR